MTRHAERRDKLRRLLKKTGADALLVTSFTNVTYLTGFTGDDSYLLVRREGEVVLSDPRYTTQLGEQCPGVELLHPPPGREHAPGGGQGAADGGRGPAGHRGRLDDRLAAGPDRRQAAEAGNRGHRGLVETLRLIKDQDEIALLRKAVWQAERAFAVLRATLRPEQTEKELVDELARQMRLFGAKDCAFPSIAAVGPRAALPHAVAGLEAGRRGGDSPGRLGGR